MIKEVQGIKFDTEEEVKTGDMVYFEGTPFAERNNVLPGTYKLGRWDAYYGFVLHDAHGNHFEHCDSTRANTFKITRS